MFKKSVILIAAIMGVGLAIPQPVSAIGGSGYLEYEEEHNNTISVNVNGVDPITGQEFYIRAFDHSLLSLLVSKEELLQTIQEQLHRDYRTADYEVVDFTSSTVLTDRYGFVFRAGEDGRVDLTNREKQGYRLTGHVVLRKQRSATISLPADKVKVYHEVKFLSGSDEDNTIFRPLSPVFLREASIGELFSSAELKAQTQAYLDHYYPGYVIEERWSAQVVHDGQDKTYLTAAEDEDYRVKERQLLTKNGWSSEEDDGNTDLIRENYIVVKRQDDGLVQPNQQLLVRYVDLDTGQLLYQDQLKVKDERFIAFADLRDSEDKSRLLYPTLDAFGLNGYVAVGPIEDSQETGQDVKIRTITVNMMKRPENLGPRDLYGYDNGYSETEALAYSYLWEMDQSDLASEK